MWPIHFGISCMWGTFWELFFHRVCECWKNLALHGLRCNAENLIQETLHYLMSQTCGSPSLFTYCRASSSNQNHISTGFHLVGCLLVRLARSKVGYILFLPTDLGLFYGISIIGPHMSYLICLHPTEEAHQSWSMCWSRQWPWSWWPSPGGWDIVRQWDPILWLTTLTLGALQLEKWTKTKLQAWYTLSVHLLDITLTLYFCFSYDMSDISFMLKGWFFKHSQCYLIIIQLSSPICQLSLRSRQLLPMPWPRMLQWWSLGITVGNRGSFPRMSYLEAPCRSSRHGGGGWLKSKDLRPSVKAMLATLGNL